MASIYSPAAYFSPYYFAPLGVPGPAIAGPGSPGPSVGATPYFSPWYFATSYFAPLAPPVAGAVVGPGSGQSPSVGATPYFAPSYFGTSYFAPLDPPIPGGAVVGPGSVSRAYRDLDAFEAILAKLNGTGAFQAWVFATPLARQALGTSATPSATLLPDSWDELDEVDPTAILRHVTFSLDLLVRADDPFSGFDQLTRLEAAAHAVIDGSDLGGGCLPALTRLRRGQYDQQSFYPEQSVRLDGEFTYMVGTTVTTPAAP